MATLTMLGNRISIAGNDYVRREALRLPGSSPRKDGTVTLPLNLLSHHLVAGLWPAAKHDWSEELRWWAEAERDIIDLGRAVNAQGHEAWHLPDLWDWQAQALARLAHGSACLFDDRGMGKTRTVVEALRTSGTTTAVVITSKRLRAVWRADIERWWAAGKSCSPEGVRWSDAAEQVGSASVTLLTYDSLLNPDIWLAVEELEPEWLVVDEAHNLKKRHAKQKGSNRSTKSGAVRSLPGKNRIAITGTPMPNAWHEVWTLLNLVAPEVFTSYWQFVEVLGRVEESYWGGKNISEDIVRKELWDDIFDRWIISRDRPRHGKVWDFVPVELSKIEQRAYTDMATEMRAEHEGMVLDASTRLAQLTRLQQLAGGLGHWETREDESGRTVSTYRHAEPSSKADALIDMVAGLRRAVVFTRFRNRAEFVARLINERTESEAVLFTGKVTERETAKRLAAFDSDDDSPMVAVCVFGTISEGINELVSAHDMFFLDWSTVKDVEQAADRLDRPGQTTEVRCVTLYSEGTVDEVAIDREGGKMRPLRAILRSPEAWAYLDSWSD